MMDLQRRFSCEMLENAGHENDGSSWAHHKFINDDMVRTKVTSKVMHSIRLVKFSFQLGHSALRPFGTPPVRHYAQ